MLIVYGFLMQVNIPVPWILWVSRCMVICIYIYDIYQHLPRGANSTLRDAELTRCSNHFATLWKGLYLYMCNLLYFFKGTLNQRIWRIFRRFSKDCTPPKTNMSPKKGTISIGNTSSNHWFLGDMLVFQGVYCKFLQAQSCWFVLRFWNSKWLTMK